jgi:hypothetical protein
VNSVSDVGQIKIHTVEPLVTVFCLLRLKLLLQSRKNINHHAPIHKRAIQLT